MVKAGVKVTLHSRQRKLVSGIIGNFELHFFTTTTYMRFSAPAFFEACRRGDLQEVHSMYDEDPACLQLQDQRGFTPLIIAVYNDNINVAEFLLEKGAKVEMHDMAGNSALMGVSFKGYKTIADRLIKAGADVNQRNANGATALTFAATFGHLEIAEMLLKNGADLNLRDSRGKSPLDHAILQENEPMIALLEKYVKHPA